MIQTVGSISPHFAWHEVTRSATATARGIDNTIPPEWRPAALMVAHQMEEVRALLGVPVVVSSWYRSPALNRVVGGERNSAHLMAGAQDWIAGGGMPLREAYRRVADSGLPFDQLIIERAKSGAEWIHAGWIVRPRQSVLVAAWDEALRHMTFRQRLAEG